MAGHRKVDVAGELDEAIDEVELAGAPRQVVRVDRDAVPAYPGTGREAHEPERLRGRRVDDLPDVEVHPLAQQGELVDERDVDVAEDVLKELGHLCRIRRRDGDDSIVDLAQQSRRALGRLRRHPAHETRYSARCAGRIARVDPFWCIGEVEISTGDETAFLDDPPEGAHGRAWVCGRLEDQQLPLADVVTQETVPPRAQVRDRDPWSC